MRKASQRRPWCGQLYQDANAKRVVVYWERMKQCRAVMRRLGFAGCGPMRASRGTRDLPFESLGAVGPRRGRAGTRRKRGRQRGSPARAPRCVLTAQMARCPRCAGGLGSSQRCSWASRGRLAAVADSASVAVRGAEATRRSAEARQKSWGEVQCAVCSGWCEACEIAAGITSCSRKSTRGK